MKTKKLYLQSRRGIWTFQNINKERNMRKLNTHKVFDGKNETITT